METRYLEAFNMQNRKKQFLNKETVWLFDFLVFLQQFSWALKLPKVLVSTALVACSVVGTFFVLTLYFHGYPGLAFSFCLSLKSMRNVLASTITRETFLYAGFCFGSCA